MVLSMIAEAARGAFGPTDVESQVKLKQRRERIRKEIDAAKAKAAADENSSPNSSAGSKSGGWFSSWSKGDEKKVDYAAAQNSAAAVIEKKEAKIAVAAAPQAAQPAAAAAPAAAPAATGEGDAKQGAALFKAKCATCHTCNEGGPNKQGPNLFGVMGRQSGTVSGFGYTKANKESGLVWTSQDMFEFLANPKAKIKGTSMAFPGFKKEKDRNDVVAYLNSLK